MPGKYPTDAVVIAEIQQLRNELKLTNKSLAKMLLIEGVSETYISEYVNDRLNRQVVAFEARFRDTVKSIRERIAFGSEIFETSVTRRIRQGLDLVRRTGDIALFTSPAGNGKTSGIRSYLRDNASAIEITLTASARCAAKVQSLVYNRIDHTGHSSGTSRFDFLVSRFKEVSRLLIVDNAQRLDGSGRQWLFDFHDAAECPIGLIGNPELLGRIRTNDQQFSRIGINTNYELSKDELPAAARRIVHQFSDEQTADEVEDLAAYIASKDGKLRAVRKTIILAQELRSVSADLRDNPRKAMRAAHSRLVRDYALPSD